MQLRPRFVASLLATICLTFALGSAARAQESAIDFRYVPSDAVGGAVAFPKKMMQRKEFELWPTEVIEAAGKQEFGFNPVDVTQAIIFGGQPGPQGPNNWGAVLHFAERQKLTGRILENFEKASFNDVEYYRAFPPQPCMCLLEGGRVLLIAPESSLQKMMSAKNADSPFRELLSKSEIGDATAALAFGPLREMTKQVVAQAPPLPPPLEELKRVPDLLESLEVTLNFNRKPSSIRTNGRDEKTAQQLVQIIEQGLEMGKQLALAEIAKNMETDSDDPVAEAMGRYSRRLVEAIGQRLTPKRKGAQLAIKVETDYATTGVLVALLLPAVQAAREAARRMSSTNNLKQIALAMHNYHSVNKRFPPAATRDDDGKPLLSWRVHLLPYLEHADLYDQFHFDEPWDSEHNRKLIGQMPPVFENPNFRIPNKTSYLLLTGKGAFGGKAKQGPRIRDFLDGTTNTILAVEANPDRAVIWTKPDDLVFNPDKPLDGLGKVRPNVFLAALVDGSVRVITLSQPNLVKRMATKDGND